MDCHTARRLMDSCRPSHDDWQAPELVGVSAHLEECAECLSQFRSRQSFDDRIASVMQAVPVPADLRERIHARLDQARVWQRRRVLASWTAAAAATLLVAAGIAFWRRTPTEPVEIAKDAKALGEWAVAEVEGHEDGEDVVAPTQSVSWQHRPEVESWVNAQFRSHVPLTSKWISSDLQAVWKSSISGAPVPVLTFSDRRGSADVFVFSHSRFIVGNLSRAAQPMHTTRNLQVVAWTEGDTTYVAVLRNWSRHDAQQLVGQPTRMI